MTDIINRAEQLSAKEFQKIEATAYFNQEKVLTAFQNNKIAARHFAGSSGYGYDDIGRDGLCAIFAETFKAEAAIVSPLIASGTHAISSVLYGLLRPKDSFLAISGKPYDTLDDVISGDNNGSLKDFGIKFDFVDLNENSEFKTDEIINKLKTTPYKLLFLQRSRGYNWRNALSISQIENIIKEIRKYTDAPIAVDNCYGSFVSTNSP